MDNHDEVDVGPYMNMVAKMEIEKENLFYQMYEMAKSRLNNWENLERNDVKINQLDGAMTNLVFILKNLITGENALLRIYGEGTELFFPRSHEIELFEMLSKKNIGIELLCLFANGRIEKLIHGKTAKAEDIRDDEIARKIAKRMKQLHDLDLPIVQEPQIFNKLYEFLNHTKTNCTDGRFQGIDFDKIEMDIRLLEKQLTNIESRMVFAHNDLQYGNIMLNDQGAVLIDFEYSDYNPRGYDIGNHFCEWMFNYHADKDPHLARFENYPNKHQQYNFCQAYLQVHQQSTSDAEIQSLCNEANQYAQASHLFWGLWGYMQASQSVIDFDFMGYANSRFDAFNQQHYKVGITLWFSMPPEGY